MDLTEVGLKKFSSNKEFLIVTGHLCNEFFYYLFGQDDPDFGLKLLKKAHKLYPDDLIVKFMTIDGLEADVRHEIKKIKTKLTPELNEIYPTDALYDVYFRELIKM